MSTVISVLAALIVMSIFVVLHELGHYCAGRIFGFGIVEFSVGMGPAIIKKEKMNHIIITIIIRFPLSVPAPSSPSNASPPESAPSPMMATIFSFFPCISRAKAYPIAVAIDVDV